MGREELEMEAIGRTKSLRSLRMLNLLDWWLYYLRIFKSQE